MPCILKQRTDRSPGVITFTHNEALRGLPAKSALVKEFLARGISERTWLFGVHIQGDCSHFDSWPLERWHDFIMWPEIDAKFLAKLPREKLLPYNCINFMPEVSARPKGMERNVDICVISRPSVIKRIHETLLILRDLMERRPNFSATLIVPDPRHIAFGEECYAKQEIDRRFYEIPRRIFSSRQLQRLSIVSSSEDSFGRYPLARNLMTDILHRSRFLLLPSHKEGTPRVVAEALQAGTPVILSRSLVSGMTRHLDGGNALFIDDEIPTAVGQIDDALTHYGRFAVDICQAHSAFSEHCHRPAFQSELARRIETLGRPVEGRWFLNELHLRLACHGQKHNYQFMNRESLFFEWLRKVDPGSGVPITDPYDEDALLGSEEINDQLDATVTAQEILNAPRTRQIFRRVARRISAGLRRGNPVRNTNIG